MNNGWSHLMAAIQCRWFGGEKAAVVLGVSKTNEKGEKNGTSGAVARSEVLVTGTVQWEKRSAKPEIWGRSWGGGRRQ